MATSDTKNRLKDEHQARIKLSQRLNGEDESAKSAKMTARSFPGDPIMAHYGKMLEFGALAARYFDLNDAQAVLVGWTDAIRAAERGDLGLSDRELTNWYEHHNWCKHFLMFLRLCNGLDEDGDTPPSGYMGVMDP